MKTYRIMNKVTCKWWQGEATCPEEACAKAGWKRGDCLIKEQTNAGGGGWRLIK